MVAVSCPVSHSTLVRDVQLWNVDNLDHIHFMTVGCFEIARPTSRQIKLVYRMGFHKKW